MLKRLGLAGGPGRIAQQAFRHIVLSDNGEHGHHFVPNRGFWNDINRQSSKVAYVMAERIRISGEKCRPILQAARRVDSSNNDMNNGTYRHCKLELADGSGYPDLGALIVLPRLACVSHARSLGPQQ